MLNQKQNQNKKTLEQWLENIDYEYLNSIRYMPTMFALTFVNFIKLVNGAEGESNKTPPMHLKMLDTIANRKKDYLVNLCYRGSGKTSLFGEYMVLYIAMMGELPGLKDISGMIYVADSMENGAKSLRKNIEFRYEHADFLKQGIPKDKFTDTELNFENMNGHRVGVK